jgi:ribosome-binding factor A
MRALHRAMPFVRHELGARIRLRRIPELHLRADDTVQRGTRVLQLLAELESGAEVTEPPPLEETLPTPTPGVPIPPAPESRAKGRARGRARPRR